MEECSVAHVRLLPVGTLLPGSQRVSVTVQFKTFLGLTSVNSRKKKISTLFRGHPRREHTDLTLPIAMVPFPSPGSSAILEFSPHMEPLTSGLMALPFLGLATHWSQTG